ncbi:hypothetical protein [Sorangium sp. So ce1335]|uniref:hypothetical protein n=1 Tax=Sorangium sp. So ce1335 TaxID=3133335 RepID=UPI003F621F40
MARSARADAARDARVGTLHLEQQSITLSEREMNRQDAKNAKKKKKMMMMMSWRPWRLGGSKFCSFQAGSTRLLL